MRDELLLYYERELDYLRKSAANFAEKYPKVASRLVLEPTKCEDPHVERLLEAFAFLAARIHLKLDDDFPEISEGLLSIVYPQLVRPLPSMSVVEFQLDAEKGKLTSGLKIDKGSSLFSKPISGIPCTFRTSYDTTLWPLSVNAAELRPPSQLKPAVKTSDSAWAIRLELKCAKDVSFSALKPDRLRFYLDGESGLVNIIYELLFSRLNRIQVRDLTPGSRVAPVFLPASAVQAVGFGPDEGIAPYPSSTFAGHRILLEYFAFPEKFLFIDLTGLEAVSSAGFKDGIEVIFLISIHLNQRRSEYQIVPDVRRPFSVEIYSVDEVTAINTATQKISTFEPFYSLRHSARRDDRSCFWLARRRPSARPNDEGTDVSLSLLDLTMSNVDPDATVLSVRTTCTNRDLPSRLPFGNQDSDFEMEGAAAMKRIVALRKPTAPVRPPLGKGVLWRLVSHLSLNYLSLVEEGKDALQEILRLYDVGRTAYSQNVIQSIIDVRSSKHFARLVSEQGVCFARGLRIDLEIDEDQFAGGGAFLFATVLERFFGLAASLNSFTQLSVRTPQRKEELHRWEPRSGRRVLV